MEEAPLKCVFCIQSDKIIIELGHRLAIPYVFKRRSTAKHIQYSIHRNRSWLDTTTAGGGGGEGVGVDGGVCEHTTREVLNPGRSNEIMITPILANLNGIKMKTRAIIIDTLSSNKPVMVVINRGDIPKYFMGVSRPRTESPKSVAGILFT